MWTDFFIWAILVTYAIVVFSTTLVVVLDNRQPAKTIAWIVVLTFLPVVGLVFFYFFGQNIRKERFISRKTFNLLTQNMLAEAREDGPGVVPEKYAQLVRMLELKNRSVPSAGNDVRLLTSGREYLAALLRDIGQARHHIHIETYIIEDDAVGRLLRDALADKAREGVEVRLLYDDVGCWNVPDHFFKTFSRSGIQAHAFLPVRFPSLTHKVNYRNHRKICIIDGQKGYIGGMNFALRYAGRHKEQWRDLHLSLRGGAVGSLQRIFLSDWCFVTDNVVSDACYFPAPEHPSKEGALLQIVSSNPVSRFPEIMYGLTWAIQHARRYLYVQTPYFMPTEPVLQALRSAAMSGVDVRLMVPLKPDGFWLRWGNDSYFADVLRAGVRVFRHAPGFLHSKCLVMDDDWCTVGSSNMDFRSFDNNFEANAFIYDAAVARHLKQEFLDDLQNCREILWEDWKRRSYARRLMESNTRILSPLL